MKYNGHKNWNHWNVHLWLTGIESLDKMVEREIKACSTLDCAAHSIMANLWMFSYPEGVTGYHIGSIEGRPHTPDGAPFTFTSIRAAIAGRSA